jgi:hypothetical protein
LGYTIGIAQTIPTFSKIFGDSTTLYGSLAITSIGDSIYFSMFDQGSPDNYQALTFIKTNQVGALTKSFRFYKPDYIFFGGQMQITSDGYLVSSGSSGPLAYADTKGTIYKFNVLTLDTEYVRYASDGNESALYGFGQLSDGSYIFSGQAGDTSITGAAPAWMVSTDSSASELWQKTMTSDDYNVAYSPCLFKWILPTLGDGARQYCKWRTSRFSHVCRQI